MDYTGAKLDGRYQLEQLVGEGGMADVYRGVDLATSTTVAVKILKEEYRDNDELVRRFMNESRAISVLNHPNIVKVFDVSVTDKLHYIVMEYIEGITLKEYIEQRGEPLTYKEVVHFLSQILRAMQHAHDKGIIHRDIKPQNIMILEDGSIKVMDFGIARLARSEIHTSEEQAIGSVHYISPEQAQGAETDHRADIYSVGIMMYEMLSATLPFEDDNAVAIAVKQISDEAVPLNEVNPSVPEGLVAITMKAMAKSPAQRYQSALEMLRDIEEFKQNPSIRFEYEYLNDNAPARYMNKVMNGKNQAPAPRATRKTGGKKPPKQKKIKRKKIGFLIPVVLGLTIAIVGVCALYTYNLLQNSENPFFGNYEEIDLPDFTGMQYSEVKSILEKSPYNHLRLKVKEESNPKYVAGQVIWQSPESDNDNKKSVKANQVLQLTIAKDYEEVKVPDVAGLSRRDAIMLMLEQGLMPYAKAERVEGNVATNIALRTEPEAGTPLLNKPGTIVTIYISTNYGQWERVVPNIEGLTLEEAQQALEAVGLQIGQHTEVETGDHEDGRVFEQNPKPGTVLTIGSDVHVQVAIAPPPPPPPDPDPVVSDDSSLSSSSSDPPPSSSSDPPPSSSSDPPPSSSSDPPSSSSSDSSSSSSSDEGGTPGDGGG